MTPADVPEAVAMQKLAFPPPFNEDYHWDPEHLLGHIALFPEGQFVAAAEGRVVGTCSNTIIPEASWQERAGWYRTVGGPDLRNFTRSGTTLYGLDITVHPEFRRQGVGRGFYEARYAFIRSAGLRRYGTGCRIPDYRAYLADHPGVSVEEYAEEVANGKATDRTLTPLLRYGLRFLGVIRNYMPDFESNDAGALLEWTP
jgi:GNAT superfamily N-acetyltransferase